MNLNEYLHKLNQSLLEIISPDEFQKAIFHPQEIDKAKTK